MQAPDITPSMRESIARLNDGESYSRCEMLPFHRASRDGITAIALGLRNTLNKTARRVTEENHHVYRVETGEFTCRDGVMVVVAVTRAE